MRFHEYTILLMSKIRDSLVISALFIAIILWLVIAMIMQFDWRGCASGFGTKTVPATDDDSDDSKLTDRLRHPALFMRYLSWKVSRNGDKPPRLIDLRWQGPASQDNTFIIAVDRAVEGVPTFRYIQVGSALEARLGRSINGLPTSEVILQNTEVCLGSLEGAYRHCARTLAPTYEYVNYDFGDGLPVTFERLILPLADAKGRIEYLMGMVVFDEASRENMEPRKCL